MYSMKRTASSTIDRTGGRTPSPDPGRRPGTDSANLRTSMVRNNFTEDDNKSKNILAWAGRVKELIGTYDHRHDTSIGQLTRATGYSDLLAACGVDSGDVNSIVTGEMSSPTKPTSYNQPKPTAASPVAKQLMAQKEGAGYLAAADKEDPAKQRRSPRSSLSMTSRAEDERRQEIRRASFSQDRGRSDYPDAAQKLPARRASQTEVKPTVTRDTSRSLDARSQLCRSSVGERQNSANERTSGSGSRALSSDNGGQRQPRKRLATRNSKETTAAPTAVGSFKQSDEVNTQKSSERAVKDESRGSATRRSYDHDAERSVPRIRNSCRPDAEDRPTSPPRRLRTSDQNDVDSFDNDEIAYRRVRAADRDWRPQEARVSRSADEESTNNVDLPSRKTSDRDRERYQREPRLPGPTDSEEKDSSESLFKRLSDLDMRRRAEYRPPERDQPQRLPGRSRPTHVEAYNSTRLRSRGREVDSYQRVPTGHRPVDVEEKDSIESLSERVSDFGMQRRAEYRPPERDEPPSQRLPDRSRPAHVELTNSTELRSRGRDVEIYQRAARVHPPVDTEEKDSTDSLYERNSDLDVRRRAGHSPPDRDQPESQRLPGRSRSTNVETTNSTGLISRGRDAENYQRIPRVHQPVDTEETDSIASERVSDLDLRRRTTYLPQRTHAPPQRVDDRSPGPDILDDHEDLSDRRHHQSQSVRGRRCLSSEGSVNRSRPRQGPRDGATSLPPSKSPGRATKPNTTPDRPPSPRPILRKSSPHPGVKDSTTAGKGKRESPESRARRSSLSPTAHVRPAAGTPLRRSAAVVAADIDDDDDNDDDDDDDDLLVTRHHSGRGRGLGKCSAVTDLFDKLDVSRKLPTHHAPNQHTRGNTKMPIKSPSTTSAARANSSSLTPRVIWEFMRPWLLSLHQLLTFLIGYTRHWLYALFCKPQVVEAGHKLRITWMKVIDDWSLFTAVIFAFVCVFLVITLC